MNTLLITKVLENIWGTNLSQLGEATHERGRVKEEN
jgi:hypothetical protein